MHQQMKQDLRRVMSLGFPAFLRMTLQSVVTIAALIMVGHLGPEAIAAVGLGSRVLFIMIAVLMAVSVGVTALVARYVGAGNNERVQAAIQHALILGLGIGFLIAVSGWFLAPAIMRGLLFLQPQTDTGLIALGTTYLRMALLPMVIGYLLFISNAIFQGAGNMKTPLYLMLGVNIINLSLMYVLINGTGPFPTMGVGGAGLAQGLSRAIGAIVALYLLGRGKAPVKLIFTNTGLDLLLVKKLLAIGLPASGENFVRQGSQVLYSIIIASWGTVTLAANQIAMSIFSLSFMPGLGFSLAATALVGQSLGAGEHNNAVKYGYLATKITLLLSLITGMTFYFLGQTIAGLYTSDSDVISLSASCLKIIALTQPALAVVQVLAGALRGAGDTKWVLYITTIGNWGVRLILSLMLGFYFGLHLLGVWWAMASDQFIRAILTLWRYHGRGWIRVFLAQENHTVN